MLQLTQQLKSGKMEILDVPEPGLLKNQVLVRNHFSVISAGTEGKTVADARKGLIAKARGRQKEVSRVIESVKSIGLKETFNVVRNKLEMPSPMGYSCAGEVIAVGDGITDLRPGDLVACGGQGAFHAEVVAVYRNLCVKVPPSVDIRQAAFATIAAIALQGIRQAEVQLGGNAVVIGLGLIGQLTVKLLGSAGVRVIGTDVDPDMVELGRQSAVSSQQRIEQSERSPDLLGSPVTRHPSPLHLNRYQNGLESIIESETHGHGADAVIITAGTSSLDPVELAGVLCRKKGKVVIVGAVPTGFSRENYYRKELDLRMSASYGPGRYDPAYEEKSLDYPVGYVRFTENRNMQSFIDLLESGKLDIGNLITHEFPLEKAPEAYDMILSKSEPHAGIVISYKSAVNSQQSAVSSEVSEANGVLIYRDHPSPVTVPTANGKRQTANVGLIGAGNFAQNILLPRMKGLCKFAAIATLQGNESVYLQRKYGFTKVHSDGTEVIRDPLVDTVFILTRHDSHARYVIEALKAGKNVFVEKPLALDDAELKEIRNLVNSQQSAVSSQDEAAVIPPPSPVTIMLGFNRRFAPCTRTLIKTVPRELPKAINIRVNAGYVPPQHWVNDPEIGGGRIIGEACHFIDLAMHIAGSPVTGVFAAAADDPQGLNNTIHISLDFANGSIATIAYYSNGNKKIPKEYIEVFCAGQVAIIDDFRGFYLNKAPNSPFSLLNSQFLAKQDKGHSTEVKVFFDSIRSGGPAPIPFEEIYLTSLVTFKVLESLRTKEKISISV